MDKLAAMKTFVRVIEAGSFSGAARTSGRSKAAVSQSISALERDLGVVLLQRTTRSLALTDSGHSYHRRCVEVLNEIAALESAMRVKRDALEGTLRVSAPLGFASRYLNLLTSDFHRKHPALQIELVLSDRFVDLVAEGIDVALRITLPTDSTLISQMLCPARIVLVASPDYLDRAGEPCDVAALAGHACLVDTNFRAQHHWRFRGDDGEKTVAVSGPFRVNSSTSIRELTLAGHGIALLPLFLVERDLGAGRLREVLNVKPDFNWSIYAVYPRREYLPGRVRVYVEYLRKAMGRGGRI